MIDASDILTEAEAVERFKLYSANTIRTLRECYGLIGEWRGRRMVYRSSSVAKALELMNVSRKIESVGRDRSGVHDVRHEESSAKAGACDTPRTDEMDKPLARSQGTARAAVRAGGRRVTQGGKRRVRALAREVDETVRANPKRLAVLGTEAL